MSPQFKTTKELRTMKLALFLEHFEDWLQYIADQQGDISEYAKKYFKEIAQIRQDRIK